MVMTRLAQLVTAKQLARSAAMSTTTATMTDCPTYQVTMTYCPTYQVTMTDRLYSHNTNYLNINLFKLSFNLLKTSYLQTKLPMDEDTNKM